MGIAFDILVIVLAIIFIVSGYKRGLIRSILGFLSIILATMLAAFLSFYSSVFIYENFVESAIIKATNDSISNNELINETQKSQNLLKKFPSFLINASDNKGNLEKNVEHLMRKGVLNAGAGVANLFKDAAVGLIRTLLFFIFLTLLLFAFKFLLKFINISKVPIFGFVDSLFGAIFGLLKYAIFVIIFFNALRFLLPAFNSEDSFLKDSSVNKGVFSENIKDFNEENLIKSIKLLDRNID